MLKLLLQWVKIFGCLGPRLALQGGTSLCFSCSSVFSRRLAITLSSFGFLLSGWSLVDDVGCRKVRLSLSD